VNPSEQRQLVVSDPGAPSEPVVRPAPHRWIGYAFGGRLPARYRSWVLHDTTTGTWWLRHVARTLVQLAVPIALIAILLPAPWQLRVAAAVGGVFLALIFSLAYMTETTENRVVKAGYPAGTAQAVRDRGGLAHQQKESERKRAAAAKRAARYRDRAGS
jgi:drug/metabolite transporter superfamily protein YnfA